MPQISIVVPAYNEEENIRILSERLVSILQSIRCDYEILIIDDGSRDRTWEAIEGVHQENSRIRGLRLSRNFGHQNALLAGLHAARGAAVITMDADMQHPPEIIPELVRHWKEGCKIVNTIRTETERESLPKRLTSRLFYRAFSWLSGSSLREGMSDFRLLDRDVVEVLKQFNEPHVFLRGLVQWIGFRTREVRFGAPARHKGSTKYSWRRMIGFALVGLTSFSILPLRLSIMVGMLTAVLAFAELCYVVVVALVNETAVPGWASTLGIISLLFGVLFIMLGVIGEYIGRVFEVAKGRPLFIVEERLSTAGQQVSTTDERVTTKSLVD